MAGLWDGLHVTTQANHIRSHGLLTILKASKDQRNVNHRENWGENWR